MPFLVLEGVDGAGKSSVVHALCSHIEAQGASCLCLREPGSTPVGERVRGILLDKDVGALNPWTEALLFCACRAEMVPRQIVPALRAGAWVVLDRYFYSTLCYQGFAQGLDVATLRSQNLEATGGLEPERVLLLDLPVERALSRMSGERDRMEGRGAAFLERVRQGYLQLAREDPDRWCVLDAGADPQAVSARAVELAMAGTRP